jgi:ATP-binding cassette subfamily F protein 3
MGKLVRYGGNYSKFEDMRAEQMTLQQNAFSKQQDKIAHLQKFIARFKAQASKAKQAQSRVKALDRMEKVAPLLAEADFTFEFKEPANLPNPMLSMSGVSFGYPAPEGSPEGTPPTVIVHNVSKSVLAGQRIGILGANGQGKSTLVKTVARDLQAIGGEVTEGKGLNIGYFAQQELDVLRPADTPLEHMIRLVREMTAAGKIAGQQTREQDLRSFLGTFNFGGDMVKQAVGSMSGGEKARLVLCMIVWQRPNLLLLDEPTNHLDLATREALAMALNEFEGTVMLSAMTGHCCAPCVTNSGWCRAAAWNRLTAIWTTTSATCWTKPSASARPSRKPTTQPPKPNAKPNWRLLRPRKSRSKSTPLASSESLK